MYKNAYTNLDYKLDFWRVLYISVLISLTVSFGYIPIINNKNYFYIQLFLQALYCKFWYYNVEYLNITKQKRK